MGSTSSTTIAVSIILTFSALACIEGTAPPTSTENELPDALDDDDGGDAAADPDDGDSPSGPDSDPDDGDSPSGPDSDPDDGDAVTVSIYNVEVGGVDPRWDALPDELSTVQLPPNYTLAAAPSADTGSVRFVLDGQDPVVDASPPYTLGRSPQGEPQATPLGVGKHTLQVTIHAASDASDAPMAEHTLQFSVTRQGTTETPGPHTQHFFWQTNTGAYLQRNPAGDFVDLDGNTVFSQTEVSIQNGVVLINGSDETMTFACIILVPDGFDPHTPYPVVVSLHHGWPGFRGTDNNGYTLNDPPLNGPSGLVGGAAPPAIVIVPQLRRVDTIDGATHEWAAYVSLTYETGTFVPADPTSVNFVPVLGLLDAMEAGTFPIDGQEITIDPARIYVTGHSMGGLGTWDILGRFPERWAAAVPMAGFTAPTTAEDVVDTPIWAFHHPRDCANLVVGTESMFQLISEAHGGTLMQWTSIEQEVEDCTVNHTRTPEWVWENASSIFGWMFAQVRPRQR